MLSSIYHIVRFKAGGLQRKVFLLVHVLQRLSGQLGRGPNGYDDILLYDWHSRITKNDLDCGGSYCVGSGDIYPVLTAKPMIEFALSRILDNAFVSTFTLS